MVDQQEKNVKAKRIWKTVLAIPEGKVASYAQIADLADLPGRARYVSKAMSLAPDTLKLPWHRVLRSSGHLAFSPESNNARRQTALLHDEGVLVLKNRVKLVSYLWQPELGEILAKLDFQNIE